MSGCFSKLSVIVPVYNEKKTVLRILSAIEAVPIEKEIIVVDDGSSDGTRELLERQVKNKAGFHVIHHDRNYGKGRAVRSGIAAATGDAIIIQDADLEYDPKDYLVLLEALNKENTPVVYGSRFANKKKVTVFWHRTVNYFLTSLMNLLFHAHLTDSETCYKLFRARVVQNISLISDGFDIDAELTAKVLKSGRQIVEVPISYKGRSFHEGKKIGWRDGIKHIIAMFRFRFS